MDTIKMFISKVNFSIISILVCIDQFFKIWVRQHLTLNESKSIFGKSGIQLINKANAGLIWEKYSTLFPGEIEFYIRYLPTFALITYSIIFLKFYLHRCSKFGIFGFSLLLAGGISNLLDHWRSYFVVDTLRIHLLPDFYQTLNIADICVSIGLIFILISLIGQFKRLEYF